MADKIGDLVQAMNQDVVDLTPASHSSGATTPSTAIPDRVLPGVGLDPREARRIARQQRKYDRYDSKADKRNTLFSLFDSALNFLMTGEFETEYIYDPIDAPRPIDVHAPITPDREPSWSGASVPRGAREFKHAADRAQRDARGVDERVARAMETFGVDTSSAAVKDNDDVYELIDKLNENGMGLIVTHDGRNKDARRKSPQQVRRLAQDWLIDRLGKKRWDALSDKDKQNLTDSAYLHMRELERGHLTRLIDDYMQNPEVQKRAIREVVISFDKPGQDFNGQADEAGFAIKSGRQVVRADGTVVPGDPYGITYIKPGRMFENYMMKHGLPVVGNDEAIIIRGMSQSEFQQKYQVTDYLARISQPKFNASAVLGPRGYGMFVGAHENAHALVADVFLREIDEQLRTKGFISIDGKRIEASSVFEMNSNEIMSAFVQVFDSSDIDPEMLRVAGTYAMSTYREKGTSIGKHEMLAELYAQRRMGLIYGEDVDKALEIVDQFVDGRHIDERAEVDVSAFTDPTKFRPATSASELSPDELEAKIQEADLRKAEERRQVLAMHRQRYKEMNEDELIDAAAEAQLNIDMIRESDTAETEDGRVMSEFFEKAVMDIRSEWTKRFGVGSASEKKRFREMVEERRESLDLLTPEQRNIKSLEARKLDEAELASTMTEGELIQKLADIDARKEKLSRNEDGLSEDQAVNEMRDISIQEEAIKTEVIGRAREKGDKRSYAKLVDEMREKVEKKNTPKPARKIKHGSRESTRKSGKVERARLRRNITKEQAQALEQLGDMRQPGVMSLLDSPQKHVAIGQAINKKHNRLKKLGLETDSRSVDSASLTEQVENIVIPAMEAIDKSSIGFAMDVEAVIDVEPGQLTGRSIGKTIDVNGFTSGKMTNRTDAPLSVSKRKNAETGKLQRRVIIEVQPGDKGIFPKTEKGETQTFSMPPGSFRVVGRDEDGTVRIRVERQKATTEVIDDLAKSVKNGKDNRLWRDSTSRKIEAINAKRVVATERSTPGSSLSSGASSKIKEKDKYPFFSQIDWDAIPERPKPIGSESIRIMEEKRRKQDEWLRSIRSAVLDLQLDPEVEKIVKGRSGDELMDMARRSALSAHRGFDKRVRVRMRESELDEFGIAGASRYSGRSLSSGAPTTGLRRKRLRELAERLGGGQSEAEAKVAKDTVSRLRSYVATGKNIEDISDSDLAGLGIERLRNADGSALKSKVTKQTIYRVNNAESALALMALGHTVALEDEGEAKMVQDASKQVNKAIQNIKGELGDAAGNLKTIDLCKFYLTTGGTATNIFCSKSIGVNREQMPQVAGRVINNESLALRAYISGHIPGETLDAHVSKSVLDLIDKTKIGLDKPIMGPDGKQLSYVDKNGKNIEVVGNAMLHEYAENILRKKSWDDLSEQEKWVVQNLGDLIVDKESLTKNMSAAQISNFQEMSSKLKTAKTTAQQHKDLGDKHSYEYANITPEEKELLYEHMDWRLLEVDSLDHFLSYLEKSGVNVGPEETRAPETLHASQRELDAAKVDGLAEIMRKELISISKIADPKERQKAIDKLKERHGLFKKIIISSDGYIVDGHHRVIGRLVANGLSTDDLEMLDMTVRKIDMPIIDLLTVSRAYQDKMGFKPASLAKGAPETYDKVGIEHIAPITKEAWDAVNTDFASELDERVAKIYSDGHFIEIDSVGLQAMSPEELSRVVSKSNIKKLREALSSPDITPEQKIEIRKALTAHAAGIARDMDSGSINLDAMSDDEILKRFAGSVSRNTDIRSIDGKPVYDVSSPAHAKALMAHGYRVNLTDDDAAKLTEEGLLAFDKAMKASLGKEISDNNPEWLSFRENEIKAHRAATGKEPSRKVMKKIEDRYKEQFTINFCNYYVAGENVFCGENVGVERESMPQLSGRSQSSDSFAIRMLVSGRADGSWEYDIDKIEKGSPEEARYKAIAKKYKGFKNGSTQLSDDDVKFLMENTDWNNTEVNVIPELRKLVQEKLKKGTTRKFVDPKTMKGAQNELVADKVAGMASTVQRAVAEVTEDLVAEGFRRGTDEFTNALRERLKSHKEFKDGSRGAAGLFEATLAASGNYMLDGHHRWAGLMMANRSLDPDQQVELQIETVDTDIISALELGRVIQDHYGIKSAKLTGETPYGEGEIKEVSVDDAEKHLKKLVEEFDGKAEKLKADKIFRRQKSTSETPSNQSLSSGATFAAAQMIVNSNPKNRSMAEARAIGDRQIAANRSKTYSFRALEMAERDLRDTPNTPENFEKIRQIKAKIDHEENMIEALDNFIKSPRIAGIVTSPRDRRTLKNADKLMRKTNLGGEANSASFISARSILQFESSGEFDYQDASNAVIEVVRAGGADSAMMLIEEYDRRNMLNDKQRRGLEHLIDNAPLSGAYRHVSESESKKFQNGFSDVLDLLDKKSKPTNKVRTAGINSLSSGEQIRTGKGKTSGRSLNEMHKSFFEKFGIPADTDEDDLPISGYLVHQSHIDQKKNAVKLARRGNIDDDAIFELQDNDVIGDGLTALGEIEVVLKPEVSNRTSYGRGSSLSSGHTPVRMNSMNEEEIISAYIGNPEKASSQDAFANLIGSSISKNYSTLNSRRDAEGKLAATNGVPSSAQGRENFEAHIFGGFDKDEVEAIHYPFSKIEKIAEKEDISDVVNERSVAETLRRSGFSDREIQYFYSISDGEPLNTQSMQMLRNYRASQKVKQKYNKLGFDNVRIAHPEGLNIENPRTYSPNASRSANIEKLITEKIMKEMAEAAEKMMKDHTKRQTPKIVSRVGSGS
ncbi:MAG: hypothetical protein ACKOQ6_07980 [Bacteroidota bacterium]